MAARLRRPWLAPLAIVAVASVALAGCGRLPFLAPTPPVSPSLSPTAAAPTAVSISPTPDASIAATPGLPDVPDELAADLPYTCDGQPFDVRLFSLPADAEREPHPSADGLRAGARFMGFPADRWWLAYRTPAEAHYITRGGEFGFWYVTVGPGPDGAWAFVRGGDCRTQYTEAGAATVIWWLDPATPRPSPEASEVEVTAIHWCESDPLRPRLGRPIIRYGGDRILMILTAVPVPGGGDSCPRAEPVAIRIGLDEPLGDRDLVDGSVWPARDATVVPEL